MKKSITSLTFAVLTTLASVSPACADTHNWNGAAITANWSTPANWAGNNPPYAGEPAPVYIIFPAGALRQINYCNIANLVVDEIVLTGDGYHIQSAAPGNAITLNNAFQTIVSSGTNNTLAVPLVLGATNVNFVVASNTDLYLTGALTGPGSFKKVGKGRLWIGGADDNTFTGPANIIGGSLHLYKSGGAFAFGGSLTVGDTNGPAYTNQTYDSILELDADQQMSFNTAITVNPDSSFDLHQHNLAIGSLTMVGNCEVKDSYGTGTLTLLGNLSVPYAGNYGYSPYISCKLSLGGADRTFDINSSYFEVRKIVTSGGGNAGIIKTGWGGLVLGGDNIYTGTTTVNGGNLYVSGVQPSSPIVVHSQSSVSSWGSFGTVNCQGGQFYPTLYAGNRNTRSLDVTMDSASTFGITVQDFEVPASPSFLTVTGTVNLGNCKFYGDFHTNATFNPSIGTQFLVIQNDGNDAINGTFAGLPEGAKFNFGGRQWQITYHGGTGNDVFLTLLSMQLPLSTDSLSHDKVSGWTHVYGTGTPGLDYELYASTNLINWDKVDDAWNDNGSLEGLDNNWYYGAPQCFYRFYLP